MFTEESPYRPRTPYNASKAGGDHAVRSYHETFGLPITITNCSNNYGPYQFPEKVIPVFTTNALDDIADPDVRVDAEQARVAARARPLHRRSTSRSRRGRPARRTTSARASRCRSRSSPTSLLELTGKPQSLKTIVPDRPGHDRRYLLDSSKIRRELGWAPLIGWEQGLRDTVEWYRANRAWWEPLKERAPVSETAWR